MRIIALFLALIPLAAVFSAEPACGPDYPADLPCLAGGAYVRMDDVPIPNAKMVLLFYEKPIIALYDEFTAGAKSAGWSVSEREVAQEADGVRYRTTLRKGEVSVGVSVYLLEGKPLLQLSVFAQ
jgi:hypothetical protein